MNSLTWNARSNSNVEFKVTPWIKDSDNKFKLEKIYLLEKLGGELSEGEIVLSYMSTDEIANSLFEDTEGEILISNYSDAGNNEIYHIPFIVKSRTISGNRVHFKIICIKKKEFIDKPISMSFSNENLLKLAKYLYMGNVISNTDPDSNTSNISLNQVSESNYNFLKKICLSYRKGTVFSFGWDGLYLKDIHTTSIGTLLCGTIAETKIVPTYDYNRVLNYEPTNSWENNNSKPKYSSSYSFMNTPFYVGSGYESLIDNYLYNKRLMDGHLYSEMIVSGEGTLPPFKIGDVVTIDRTILEGDYDKADYKNYLVKSIELFFATDNEFFDDMNRKFSFTSRLASTTEGTWSLKD